MVRSREWVSQREIARRLERHHSTINRELKRNLVNEKYSAKKAKHKAYVRRLYCKKRMKKIRDCTELEEYIKKQMKDEKWSPEQIAGAWNLLEKWVKISHETIYQYIYSQRWVWLREYLYMKRKRRKKRGPPWVKRELIKNRTWIEERPSNIWMLVEFGHYEADLVMWPQWSKACLLVLVEKLSRYKIVIKLESKSPRNVKREILKLIKKWWIKSITFDNWVEFMYHDQLWLPTYFCRPYHSRQKGQVERANRDIRKFFPKGTDFTNNTQEEIDIATKKVNNTPMKVLERKTPSYIYALKFNFLVTVAFGPWT